MENCTKQDHVCGVDHCLLQKVRQFVVAKLVDDDGHDLGDVIFVGFTKNAGRFTNGKVGPVCSLDYAPFFADAVQTVTSACESYRPPR